VYVYKKTHFLQTWLNHQEAVRTS